MSDAIIEKLRDALKPFADCADDLNGFPEDGVEPAPKGEWAKFRLLTDDYRRARDVMNATKYKIWWLSNEACVSARVKAGAPKYLKDQFASRQGRNGRGRLWIDASFGPLYLPRYAQDRIGHGWTPGGIVILAQDAKYCDGGFVQSEELIPEPDDED